MSCPCQLFDVLFFVLIPVVMLSIVSGIIIDAFGASRDHRNDVTEDQEGACFICRCVVQGAAHIGCYRCHGGVG